MFAALTKRLFGSVAELRMKPLHDLVAAVNALEPEMKARQDHELRAMTDEFRVRIAAGTSLDEILVPAFAALREASRRILGQRHHDVQVLCGIVLHRGGVAEMRTGEGKTLAATLPVYLNALEGKGVHVVTVNGYLARRDATQMAKLFTNMNVDVGIVEAGMDDDDRRRSYACGVTYGTNSELGFDWLRDNLRHSADLKVQRGHHFAVVDEVDSILVDEARTPLVISGPAADASDLCRSAHALVATLPPGSTVVDEKLRTATMTEEAEDAVEAAAVAAGLLVEGSGLYDPRNAVLLSHLGQAVQASTLYERDRHYVVRGDEVVVVDEFTGRTMEGRRFSEGLHQALEAKEGVKVRPETATLASVTYQNYFRLYGKLSGMTGTAVGEADEFAQVYGMGVTEIPTNRPMIRLDEDDEVYRDTSTRDAVLVEEVVRANDRRQPVLVGTASVDESERIAVALEAAGFERVMHGDPVSEASWRRALVDGTLRRRFTVLNAKAHGHEAGVVAEAGAPGAVTVATNMAGRGTDIVLGGDRDSRVATLTASGHDAGTVMTEALGTVGRDTARVTASGEAGKPGGLYVLGVGRHSSRRVDDQLRGRAGRQGDPGRSKFLVSLEDDLMRVFGSPRLLSLLDGMGVRPGDAISNPLVTKGVAKAQSKVEERDREARREVLRYDDVVAEQRRIVLDQRSGFMASDGMDVTVREMRHVVVEDLVAKVATDLPPSEWDMAELKRVFDEVFGVSLDRVVAGEADDPDEVTAALVGVADSVHAGRTARFGEPWMRAVEKAVALDKLDEVWREHVQTLERLRESVRWRSYAQKDPLAEFKVDSYAAFEHLARELRWRTTSALARAVPVAPPTPAPGGVPA